MSDERPTTEELKQRRIDAREKMRDAADAIEDAKDVYLAARRVYEHITQAYTESLEQALGLAAGPGGKDGR